MHLLSWPSLALTVTLSKSSPEAQDLDAVSGGSGKVDRDAFQRHYKDLLQAAHVSRHAMPHALTP